MGSARAEAAARQTADELAAKRESTGEENRGLLGSIQDGAKSLLSSVLPSSGDTTPASDAMESVAWGADEAKQRAGEYRVSAQKAEEYIGATEEKAGECKEEVLHTAEEKSTPAEKLEVTKEAAKVKTSEYTGTAAETKEEAKNKTGEYDGTVADKAGEYKDTKDAAAPKAKEAKNKIGEYKGSAGENAIVEKAGETQNYTADKGKESKDTVAGKLGKCMKPVVGVVRKVLDFLTGKKEEAKEKVRDTAEKAEEKLGDTTESGKQKKMEMDEEMRDYNQDDSDEEVAIIVEVIRMNEIELGNPWARRSVRKETKVQRGKHLDTEIGEEVRSNSWEGFQ